MSLNSQQQTRVVNLADSHVLILSSTSALFNWFQQAVAGNRAEADFADAVAPLNARVESDPLMNSRLQNEWSLFTRTLSDAYGNFGRDVIHRMGVDEPAQVRNLALSIAAGAVTRIKQNSREFLVTQIEASAA
jgi:hypothetical protein